MKKTFVVDTNVLLSDGNAIFSFQENDVVLPLIVFEELDRHKDRQDEAGRNARETSRKLSGLTTDVTSIKDSISLGDNKGKLRILSINQLGYKSIHELVPSELQEKSGDNQILAVCKALQIDEFSQNPENLVLVTRDILLRLKAKCLGISAEDYKKLHVAKNAASLYTGVTTIKVESLEDFYSEGKLIPDITSSSFHENEFVVMEAEGSQGSGLGRYRNGIIHKITEFSPCKIDAKNKEQKFALDLLLDPHVSLVSLAGIAGCGKTLLAIASGLHQVLNQKKYKTLVVCRPIQPLGKDIGYLPGTMEEKMEPWVAPIKDNLRFLLSAEGKKSKKGEETMQMLFDEGVIEVEALTFIRGRSIANAYIIIDEAQNLNAHELKTIITRVGEGTKVVLTGDIEQIDNMYVDSVSNGLTVAIEKFKDSGMTGHVTLTKGERSSLATLAASIL